MNREFDFIDLYYLNDTNNEVPTEDFAFFEEGAIAKAPEVIKISGATEEDSVAYTYAKFLEILDTQGLEGLVTAK